MFSAMAHGKEPGAVERALTMLGVVSRLDAELARLYADLVIASLSAAARMALEEFMDRGTYEYQSDFARKYVAQGKAEGRVEGEAQALLTILTTRGLAVTEEQRQRILACADLDQLEGYLRRAISAARTEDVLA